MREFTKYCLPHLIIQLAFFYTHAHSQTMSNCLMFINSFKLPCFVFFFLSIIQDNYSRLCSHIHSIYDSHAYTLACKIIIFFKRVAFFPLFDLLERLYLFRIIYVCIMMFRLLIFSVKLTL